MRLCQCFNDMMSPLPPSLRPGPRRTSQALVRKRLAGAIGTGGWPGSRGDREMRMGTRLSGAVVGRRKSKSPSEVRAVAGEPAERTRIGAS